MLKIKIILSSLVIIVFLSFSFVSAAPLPAGEIDLPALDQVVEAQMEKHGLPGVALAVFDEGKIIYLKGYGAAGDGRPMTAQTPMLIGSQSKSFTALAIAQLVEKGKLDFNAPIQAYIPWFRVADEDASGQITLDHLLHHTSGHSDAGYGVVLPMDASPEQAVRSLANAKLTAAIGTKHQYFNIGYSVLAYIIEQVSGETYARYVQKNILAPLGMSASSADSTAGSKIPPGNTRLFGFSIPMREEIPIYGVGEGFIVSTAEDMGRYALAFLEDGGGLVSPEMVKRIFTPGPGNYGLGWYIHDGGTKILHGGANQTFHTEVNLYPGRERGFVLITNQGYQVDHFISVGQLTESVEAVILGRTPPAVSQGWSVRWVGWGLGLLVLGLLILHTRNFLALRGWRERSLKMTTARRRWDVAISFIIPTAIMVLVFWQVANFYGNRFNIWTNLAYFRFGLPDVFILMIVGTLPDYIQGVIKVILTLRK